MTEPYVKSKQRLDNKQRDMTNNLHAMFDVAITQSTHPPLLKTITDSSYYERSPRYFKEQLQTLFNERTRILYKYHTTYDESHNTTRWTTNDNLIDNEPTTNYQMLQLTKEQRQARDSINAMFDAAITNQHETSEELTSDFETILDTVKTKIPRYIKEQYITIFLCRMVELRRYHLKQKKNKTVWNETGNKFE